MDVEHDLGRFLTVLLEDVLENVDYELHRRVVVVQHQHLIHGRLLGPSPGQRERAAAALAVPLPVVAARRLRGRPTGRPTGGLVRPAEPVAIEAPVACTTQRGHCPDHTPKLVTPPNYIVSASDSATSAAASLHTAVLRVHICDTTGNGRASQRPG